MNSSTKISIGVGIIVILALAWWLGSPLFITKEVHEDSPLLASSGTTAASGSFVGSAHEVSGDAMLIDHDGVRTLRFENFNTLNGPDLRVYLATDTTASDFVDLGELAATSGELNIAVPENTDVSKYNYVLIWCRAFSVNFGYAVLTTYAAP